MKKFFLSAFAVLFSVLLAAPVACAQKLVIVTIDKESTRVRGNGPCVLEHRPGWQVELLQMAAEKTGVELEFRRMPWKQALASVRTGTAHAAFNSSYRSERDEYGAYPMKLGQPDPARATLNYAYWLYVRRGSSVSWDGKTLAGLKKPIAADKGSAIVSTLKKMNVPVTEAVGYEGCLRLLKSRRADAVAGFGTYVDLLVNAWSLKVNKLQTPLLKQQGFLMFSQTFYDANTKLCESFWNAIGDIRNSQEFEQLRASYEK